MAVPRDRAPRRTEQRSTAAAVAAAANIQNKYTHIHTHIYTHDRLSQPGQHTATTIPPLQKKKKKINQNIYKTEAREWAEESMKATKTGQHMAGQRRGLQAFEPRIHIYTQVVNINETKRNNNKKDKTAGLAYALTLLEPTLCITVFGAAAKGACRTIGQVTKPASQG